VKNQKDSLTVPGNLTHSPGEVQQLIPMGQEGAMKAYRGPALRGGDRGGAANRGTWTEPGKKVKTLGLGGEKFLQGLTLTSETKRVLRYSPQKKKG